MTIYAYTEDEREEAEQVEREERDAMNRITLNAQGQDISSEQFTIPPVLNPENLKRLVDIGNRLYNLNMIDRWSREDREEYVKLTSEREKIRRGESYV